jgi:hypothetical protein
MRVMLSILLMSFLQFRVNAQSLPPSTFDDLLEIASTRKFPFCDKLALKEKALDVATDENAVITYKAIDMINVSVYVYTNEGELLLSYPNLTAGVGRVEIKKNVLPPGQYIYALVANSRIIDKRKMTVRDTSTAGSQ